MACPVSTLVNLKPVVMTQFSDEELFLHSATNRPTSLHVYRIRIDLYQQIEWTFPDYNWYSIHWLLSPLMPRHSIDNHYNYLYTVAAVAYVSLGISSRHICWLVSSSDSNLICTYTDSTYRYTLAQACDVPFPHFYRPDISVGIVTC